MKNETLTPEESFDLINKTISNFKINYKNSSKMFLLWGWMISLASFSHFFLIKILINLEASEQIGLFSMVNWAVFVFSAIIIQVIMARKIDKTKIVFSHVENFINSLWQVSSIAMFIAVFLCIKLNILPPPLLLLLAGIATLITGLVIKFKPLIFGGVAFFIFCIATTFVDNETTLLINGVAIICGYLVPGYYLKSAKE